MSVRRSLAIVVVVAATAMLAACTSAPQVVKRSSVTVAVAQPFTSYNPVTAFGATAVNREIVYATNSGFEYYDNRSRLIADTSFGSVTQVGSSPLAVRYTVNSGVKWSDGVSVGGADLLLAWAAGSGALNTPGFDPRAYLAADGSYRGTFPKDVVWFDNTARSGLRYVTALPTLSSGGRSLTLSYDEFYVDWKSAFEIGLPAHVVAQKAFGIASPGKADAAVVSAIQNADPVALAKLSRAWNTAFNLRTGKSQKGGVDTSLFVGDGPYTVSSVAADGSVTLSANSRYTGSRRPRIQDIRTRVLPSSAKQIAALSSGAVDVITPSATARSVKALINLPKITIASGFDATFEHLDLQFAHGKSGTFTKLAARQAFLRVIPRKKILDQIAGAFQDETAPRDSFMTFPGSPTYADTVSQNGSSAYAAVDVIGAKALLKRAHLHHPTVCILFDPKNATTSAEYALIKASADKAGFRVTDCSSSNWQTELGSKGAYDASLFGWLSTSSAVTAPTERLHSGASGENYNFYSSPVTDKLLGTLSHTTDAAGRTQLLTEIDRQLFADGYGLPLFQLPSLTAFRTTVTGIRRSPFAPGVFWNIWEWRPTR